MSKCNNCSFNMSIYKEIGKQLHFERLKRQRTLKYISKKTKIPINEIDAIELGISFFSRKKVYELADYYGKVVRFYLKDRE